MGIAVTSTPSPFPRKTKNVPITLPRVMEATRTPTKERRLAALRGALREGSWRGAARMVAAMHPAEIANLIESLPPAQREVVWNFVEPEVEGDVLVELSDGVREALIAGMDAEELLAAAEDMELDDLADLVGDLPEAVARSWSSPWTPRTATG